MRVAVLLIPMLLLSVGLSPAEEVEQEVRTMTFENDSHGWKTGRYGRAYLRNGVLQVEATDGPPQLTRFSSAIGGEIRINLTVRTRTPSDLILDWTTRGSPRRSEDKRAVRTLNPDGNWNSYEFLLPIPDVLTGVSILFDATEGAWEIKSIAAFRKRVHPLSVRNTVLYKHRSEDGSERDMLRYTVHNDAPGPLTFRVEHLAEPITLPGRETIDLAVPIREQGHLAAVDLRLHPNDFPGIGFPVFLYRPEGKTDWISRPFGSRTLDIAPDGRMARIRRGDEVLVIVAPIVHRGGLVPVFSRLPDAEDGSIRFESPDVSLILTHENDSMRFQIVDRSASTDGTAGTVPLEGPAVRIFGTLQSALLPGVEFLGEGDVSSSTVDLEEPYNIRRRPLPDWITMPLAVMETDKGAAVLRWTDMTLRPTFASPNSFDRTDDHRISLIGSTIDATLDVWEPTSESEELEKNASIRALRAHVARQGFPEPPAAPRTPEQQAALSLAALRGPLRSEDGVRWGYAAESEWTRKAYADMLSTMIRLDERIPKSTTIVSGGADIANDAVYFLTERVEEWKKDREEAIRSILALRNPNGSFLRRTRFPEVENAATAFGYTAIRTLEIMEFVRLTGNRELFETAVAPSLENLKQCDVPRGGFYQDSPLHTPDLYTAATLTWLFTWAHEFTGETDYLESARRFAFRGLPFVYQWSNNDIMLYVTVPKFGGTERRTPLWFGASQPRVGIVYAYALNQLSKYDRSVDWQRVARGILHATEKIQQPDGDFAGCVPETFVIANQQRLSWNVNPCALVSLRRALEGRIDSFCVLVDRSERYVAPYQLRPTATGIEAVDVPEGRKFQILRNGSRIVTAEGAGPISQD